MCVMKLLFCLALILLCVDFPGCICNKNNAIVSKNGSAVYDPIFDSLKQSLTDSTGKLGPVGDKIPANIGDTVLNGVFIYYVENVSFCKRIKSDAMHETAGGIYLLVILTFVNHDNQSHVIDKSLVKLIDAKNTVYGCSGPASDALAMSGKKVICAQECKPGTTISGTMVFDVPSKEGDYRLEVSNGAWKEKTREICLTKPKDTLQIPY